MTEEVWYFTFCGKHKEHDCYVKFSGTHEEARDKMLEKFGSEWGFQYSEDEADDAIHSFNLRQIHE